MNFQLNTCFVFEEEMFFLKSTKYLEFIKKADNIYIKHVNKVRNRNILYEYPTF